MSTFCRLLLLDLYHSRLFFFLNKSCFLETSQAYEFSIIYLFKVIWKNENVIPQYLSADLYFLYV